MHPLRLGVCPGAVLGGVTRQRVLRDSLLARRAALARAARAAAVAADPVPELGELAVERDGGELHERLAHERAHALSHQQILRRFVAHRQRQRAPDELADARVLAVARVGYARLLEPRLDDVQEADAEHRFLRIRPTHAAVGPERVRGFGFDIERVGEARRRVREDARQNAEPFLFPELHHRGRVLEQTARDAESRARDALVAGVEADAVDRGAGAAVREHEVRAVPQ